MARLLPLLLLLLPALLLFLLPSPCASLPIRLNLTHINSKFSNISIEDLNRLAIKRSKLRLAFISSRLSTSSPDVRTNVQFSNEEYTADLTIGTPPVSVSTLLDTGSDLIWTKCEQGSAYDPSASSTYSPLPCGSNYCQSELTSCADGSTCSFDAPYGSAEVGGTMGTETFSFGGTNVPSLAFGCSNSEQGSATSISGLLGMGGGQLSLVSQLGSGKFSYCLTTYGSQSTSPLFLGSLATPDSSSQSTPLVKNPNIPTYYYLSLQGITVGSTRLSIPSSAFEISSDGRSGGLIIDSGTSYTFLVSSAYDVLKQEFQSQMGLPVVSGNTFDLCFSSPSDSSFQPPKLIFNFEGADMDLPKENYLVSDGGGNVCLAILPSNQSLSLFGNFQQQNMHIVYDVQGSNLYFAPSQCESL